MINFIKSFSSTHENLHQAYFRLKLEYLRPFMVRKIIYLLMVLIAWVQFDDLRYRDRIIIRIIFTSDPLHIS